MNKIVVGVISVLGGTAAVLTLTAARHQETIQPGTKVGTVDVGGLTPDEASRKLRVWWEGEKLKELKLKSQYVKKGLPAMRPTQLGVTLDDAASVQGLPMQEFLDAAQAAVGKEEKPSKVFPVRFKLNGVKPEKLAKIVSESVGEPKPARVTFKDGAVLRKAETAGLALNEDELPTAVMKALEGADRVVKVPVQEAPKRVPDEELKKIREVMSEFSTRFSAGNRPRSANIRLAASKIDGTVLMPGDKLSFNGTVGRRTVRAGFRPAGVYINGRHDTGIGGGICQVSTTLYNAALFGNLKIAQRSNHSMPVPYVPVGRDATVDYGNIDLVIENNYDFPIAVTSQYRPGRLTFRLLGDKKEGLSVKVTQSGHRRFASRRGTQTVYDPRLPRGTRRVIEGGSMGQSVNSYRHVYENGKLVRTEPLGRSVYTGGASVIAVGTGVVRTPSVARRRSTAPAASTPSAPSEPEVAPATEPNEEA